MDLVDHREETRPAREDYLTFAEQLPGDLDIPLCPAFGAEGDMSPRRARIRWYSGPTLPEVPKR